MTRSEETALVSIEIAVDPATAFDVFTADVDDWWARGPRNRFRAPWAGLMRFEPGVGGRFLEIYDEEAGDIFEVGRIKVWEPGKRLVFDWRLPNFSPGEITQVEILFEATGVGTRVTIEHRGWEALPLAHPARHRLSGRAFGLFKAGWWGDLLTRFKAEAERKT